MAMLPPDQTERRDDSRGGGDKEKEEMKGPKDVTRRLLGRW
jgi:hypothetical protein